MHATMQHDELRPGDERRSAGGTSALVFRRDGEVVVVGPDGSVVWAMGTAGRGAVTLRVRDDGDLVAATASGEEVWAAREHGGELTATPGGCALVVGDDGEVVVRDAAGAVLWSTRGVSAGPQVFTSFAVLLKT
jgi:hypothetical protein